MPDPVVTPSKGTGGSGIFTGHFQTIYRQRKGSLPQTQAEARDPGIPYKVRRTTLYLMNLIIVAVEQPAESSQDRQDLKYPYDYGATIGISI